MKMIKIGTRKSPLAIRQAEMVKSAIERSGGSLTVEIVGITTEGDRQKDDAGTFAKGGFVRAIEEKILSGEVDAGVHSLKDMPSNLPSGLKIVSVLEREDPRDVLITNNGKKLPDVCSGAVIGTSSPRRKAILKHIRKDIVAKDIRGNVDTRIKKVDSGAYDGIVLAAAGLIRLGIENRITEFFDTDLFVPAPGQGVIAIETSSDNNLMDNLFKSINHYETACAVKAERAFVDRIGVGCDVPVGVYAKVRKGGIFIHSVILSCDGNRIFKNNLEGAVSDAGDIGEKLADMVIRSSAMEIITAYKE